MQFLARLLEPQHERIVQAASAATPVAIVGADKAGAIQSDAIFWGSLVVLVLQGVWWVVRIVFKVLREREALRRGDPPVSTDAGKL
jgi:hypothetical protein